MHKLSIRTKTRLYALTAILLCLSIFPAAVAEASQIRVAWNPVSNSSVIGYKVYYGTSSRDYQQVRDVQDNLSCLISGIVEGQQYYIAITAYTAEAESSFSYELTYPPGLDARSFSPILSLLTGGDAN